MRLRRTIFGITATWCFLQGHDDKWRLSAVIEASRDGVALSPDCIPAEIMPLVRDVMAVAFDTEGDVEAYVCRVIKLPSTQHQCNE